MVTRFGMSDKLGPRVFGHDHGHPFLGARLPTDMDCSSELARQIDEEIRLLIAQASAAARRALEDPRGQLAKTSDILLRRETIEREQFVELLEGKTEDEVFVDAPPSGRHPPRPARRQRQSGARGAAGAEGQPAPARAAA